VLVELCPAPEILTQRPPHQTEFWRLFLLRARQITRRAASVQRPRLLGDGCEGGGGV